MFLHMKKRMLLCAFCRCNSCISHKMYLFYCPLGGTDLASFPFLLLSWPGSCLDLGSDKCFAEFFQEKLTSVQFSGILLLVYFSPQDISIVSRHVHNVIENHQRPTGSLCWWLYVAVTLSRLSAPPLVAL